MTHTDESRIGRLERLGARRLAELLEDCCEADPALRERLDLALAAAEAPGSLTDWIDSRLQAYDVDEDTFDDEAPDAGPDTDEDWLTEDEARAEAEIDTLRQAIAEELGARDPQAAADRMLALLERSDGVVGRLHGDQAVALDVMWHAIVDLGRLWEAAPDQNLPALAERVVDIYLADEYGTMEGLLTTYANVFGAAGQALLKDLLTARLDAVPAPSDDDWQVGDERAACWRGLRAIAELQGDIDGFLAAGQTAGFGVEDAAPVVGRLIEAGRAAEALDWLDQLHPKTRALKPWAIDLRIEALARLGRIDEAQAERWRYFELSLSLSHLFAFLETLSPDEAAAARERAIAHALAYEDAVLALEFLLGLPDLPAIVRLVETRLDELPGNAYDTIGPAAERLAADHPVTATVLYRRLIEDILMRSAAGAYHHAIHYVRSAEALAPRLPVRMKGHVAFMQTLRQRHGRKWKFWKMLDAGQAAGDRG